MKRISWVIASLLIILAILFVSQKCVSCKRPQQIPKDKEVFIGTWRSRSGFQIEIKSSGIANVIPIFNPKNHDYNKLDIGVMPKYAKEMLIGFEGDSILWVMKPTVRYKAFRINRNPFLDGDTSKFILNGVVLIRQQ
jgi:hypothetical protein